VVGRRKSLKSLEALSLAAPSTSPFAKDQDDDDEGCVADDDEAFCHGAAVGRGNRQAHDVAPFREGEIAEGTEPPRCQSLGPDISARRQSPCLIAMSKRGGKRIQHS
jgi:hypothetical protein